MWPIQVRRSSIDRKSPRPCWESSKYCDYGIMKWQGRLTTEKYWQWIVRKSNDVEGTIHRQQWRNNKMLWSSIRWRILRQQWHDDWEMQQIDEMDKKNPNLIWCRHHRFEEWLRHLRKYTAVVNGPGRN